MTSSIIVVYLHYLSFMLCFAALAVEALTLKRELDVKDGWKILIADAVYGIFATSILVTGVLRVIYFGKGADYYLNNPFFYIKVATFIFVGTLSLYPTISFVNWLRDLLQGQAPTLELTKFNRLLWIIRAELVGFTLIPLFAVIMAAGVGIK
jgi:putative membrane protein